MSCHELRFFFSRGAASDFVARFTPGSKSQCEQVRDLALPLFRVYPGFAGWAIDPISDGEAADQQNADWKIIDEHKEKADKRK